MLPDKQRKNTQTRFAGCEKKDKRFKRYVRAQKQNSITYDPEVRLPGSRVMSGPDFDSLLTAERNAVKTRQQTRESILAKRSDLLVPLATEQPSASLYKQPKTPR